MDWELQSGGAVKIFCGEQNEAVKIAACNLAGDIGKVFSGKVTVELCFSGEADAAIVIRQAELGHREAYSHSVKDGVLYIEGQDRRGIIYGIYELSRWLGVSPWYYFADVPVKRRDKAVLPDGYFYSDYPSVEYLSLIHI